MYINTTNQDLFWGYMNNNFSFFAYYPKTYFQNEDEIVISYTGPLSSSLIAGIGKELKEKIPATNNMQWKTFAVMLELIQNTYHYSCEFNQYDNNDPIGTIIISEVDDGYQITTANLSTQDFYEQVEQRCSVINKMSLAEKRQYKSKLISQHPLILNKYSTNDEEKVFFSITTSVNKTL